MNGELTLAIEELRQYGADREWFIPVLLSECDVPARSIGAGETFLDINWVPLNKDWNAGLQRILSVIKPIPPEIQILISALRSEDKEIRQRAALALGNIGPEAKDAVPALIETFKDEDRDVRWEAVGALGEIGPEAVSALIEALKSRDKQVCFFAGQSLRSIGPEARVAVPALIKALADPSEYARMGAAAGLAGIGLNAKVAVPALIEVLENKDRDVREWAAKVLEKFNTPEARKALADYKKQSI